MVIFSDLLGDDGQYCNRRVPEAPAPQAGPFVAPLLVCLARGLVVSIGSGLFLKTLFRCGLVEIWIFSVCRCGGGSIFLFLWSRRPCVTFSPSVVVSFLLSAVSAVIGLIVNGPFVIG